MIRFDLQALRSGAGVCLVFAVPFSVAANWAGNRDDESLALLFILCALAGFVLGAGVAAWVQQRDYPLAHGIVTAIATYAATQAIFILIAGLRGREIHWFAALFNIAPVMGAGLIGGFLGQRLQRKGLMPRVRRPDGST